MCHHKRRSECDVSVLINEVDCIHVFNVICFHFEVFLLLVEPCYKFSRIPQLLVRSNHSISYTLPEISAVKVTAS